MTDEAKALVEWLRDDLPQTLIEKHWVDDNDAIYKQREEAADLIETQAREIERLRGVLRDIVDNCGQCGGYGTYPEEEAVTGKVLWWDCSSPQCQSARAALAGDSHDQ